MTRYGLAKAGLAAAAAAFVFGTAATFASGPVVLLPKPAVDTPAAQGKKLETAVLAGGCFWGVEAVYEQLKGVTNVVVGYSGGNAETAKYNIVTTGRTGHAESVRITYDPSQVTYGQLLQVFFSVVHDPTQLNRQGPDVGTHYRSAIFYANEEQKKVAQAYIAQLGAAKAFPKPIVTEVAPLKAFYEAEAYHQDFAAKNPSHAYIVAHDVPKVMAFQKTFPDQVARK